MPVLKPTETALADQVEKIMLRRNHWIYPDSWRLVYVIGLGRVPMLDCAQCGAMSGIQADAPSSGLRVMGDGVLANCEGEHTA